MTTESATFTGDPSAKPVPRLPETPEERKEAGRRQRQAYDNMEYLDEIFDDLLEQHPGRLALVYGDRQILISDDGYVMKQSLTEEERPTATLQRITKWWIRHCGEPE